MMLQTTVYAAARSRPHGPTAALWHAVEMHRPTAEVDGACELTLCGSLARVDGEQPWPTPARARRSAAGAPPGPAPSPPPASPSQADGVPSLRVPPASLRVGGGRGVLL